MAVSWQYYINSYCSKVYIVTRVVYIVSVWCILRLETMIYFKKKNNLEGYQVQATITVLDYDQPLSLQYYQS